MTLRVVIVTTLLVSAFSIELLFYPAQSAAAGVHCWPRSPTAWCWSTPCSTAGCAERALHLPPARRRRLVITLFVQITGGLDSPMSFLYLLPISVASMVLFRNGALALAGVCFAGYAGLILFDAAAL